jgi:oligopeptide/dipeptide ABC transporter ATP-binding protein
MYTGKIVEESNVEEIFEKPRHPYTQGLLRSVPKLTAADIEKSARLQTIEGVRPDTDESSAGMSLRAAVRISNGALHARRDPFVSITK